MQAGLVMKSLSCREIFTSFFLFFLVAFAAGNYELDFRQSYQGLYRNWSQPNNASPEKHQNYDNGNPGIKSQP
jgi:hypothetical protein